MSKTPPSKGPKQYPVRRRAHSLSPPLLQHKYCHKNTEQSKGELELQNVKKSLCYLVRTNTHIISDDSLPRLTAVADGNSEIKSNGLSQGQQSEGLSITNMPALPEKVKRMLNARKREYMVKRKALVSLQNSLIEHLASIKDLENRSGIPHDETIDKLSILTLSNWPSHDLLLLLKDLMEVPVCSDVNNLLGSIALEKVMEQLRPIYKDVGTVCSELLNSLKQLSLKPALKTSIKTKTTKSSSSMIDLDMPKLSALVDNLEEKVKSRIEGAFRVIKLSWLDREDLIKKIDNIQKELFALKHKTEEQAKCEDTKEAAPIEKPQRDHEKIPTLKRQSTAELENHREADSIKENMLRVGRARIVILEKELNIARAEIDTLRRNQKENEQFLRQRENAFEARLKKLTEHSKHDETVVETLTRQRDALEIRVKELREQADKAEKTMKERNLEVLQVKAMDHHTDASFRMKCVQLEKQVSELQTQLKSLREYSEKLLEVTKSKCLEYVPVRDDSSSEQAPTSMEVDIYMELKSTRINLKQMEDDLRKSIADREALLKSLYEIARGEGEEKETKLAEELVNREKKLCELQTIIKELRQQLIMKDQANAELKNTIQAVRTELIKVRTYDAFNGNDFSDIGIEEEMIDLYSRCKEMSRERSQMLSTAAARSLMLERYERAADMFTQIVTARQTLIEALEGKPTLGPRNMSLTEMSRSLSALCEDAVDTWSALYKDRTRVQRLESELETRNQQLEREAKVRTHLEQRRAALVRALMVNPNPAGVDAPPTKLIHKVKQPPRSPEKRRYLARIGSLFKF